VLEELAVNRWIGWLLLGTAVGCSSRDTTAVKIEDEGQSVKPHGGKEKKDEKKPGAPFKLPTDEGGVLVGKLLPLSLPAGPLANPESIQRTSTGKRDLNALKIAPSPSEGLTPRLPAPKGTAPIYPELVEEEELEGAQDAPVVPRRPRFYAGEAIRVRSMNVNLPPPLPALAEPVSDRASLEDATQAATTRAVLTAVMPDRTKPVPYEKLSVPEPYENRRPLLVPLPGEEETPETAPPQRGKPS
jgi:hypothetical protein